MIVYKLYVAGLFPSGLVAIYGVQHMYRTPYWQSSNTTHSTTYTVSLRHLVNAILRSASFSKVYPELDAPKTR